MKSDIDVILHILASFYFGVIEVHLGPRLYGYQNWLAFIWEKEEFIPYLARENLIFNLLLFNQDDADSY